MSFVHSFHLYLIYIKLAVDPCNHGPQWTRCIGKLCIQKLYSDKHYCYPLIMVPTPTFVFNLSMHSRIAVKT